jgi:tetratricopeptide (TPR) repeat protein
MSHLQDWLDEAFLHQQSGRFDDAAPLYERVLRFDPGHPAALLHLGKLELARANPAAGIELLRQAAASSPDNVEVHQSLGVAYKSLGQWGDAAQSFERAISVDPNYAPSYFELAELSQSFGRPDAAVSFYLRAINLDPSQTEAFRRLGELLYARENWVGAENCFQRVLDVGLLENDRDAHLNLLNKLGIALARQEKLERAAQVFSRILELAPAIAEMHSNLAFIYERQGKLQEALAAGQRAVEMKPEYAEGHNNLGVVWRALHRLDEARSCFEAAVRTRPDFALAHFNLGAIHLMQGDYPAGWKEYEWRNRTPGQSPRQFTAPRWEGEPIPGRVLLVHAEQGYGDTIQFARFLKPARERSQARIVFEGPGALLPLLREIGADEVIRAASPIPEIDFEIPLPSLPGALGIGIDNLPRETPYLAVPESSCRLWRERIALVTAASGPSAARREKRVGIVWRGNPAQEQDAVRSCPLSKFADLADIPGIAWFSLQREIDASLLRSVWPGENPIEALGPLLGDFADTAAAIGELDLLISVDTAAAHLAGALGRPVWALLSHTPDWRWQLDRRDSVWYPGMRLFRQQARDDWDGVFQEVAQALRDWTK